MNDLIIMSLAWVLFAKRKIWFHGSNLLQVQAQAFHAMLE
jgi:hypothetical protein